MPYDFHGFGFSGSELLGDICRLAHESRCLKDEIHDSSSNTHKYARKLGSLPLDEGMDRYLRIEMGLVPVRDRGGEMSNLDLLRGGRALRWVRTLHQPGSVALVLVSGRRRRISRSSTGLNRHLLFPQFAFGLSVDPGYASRLRNPHRGPIKFRHGSC